MALEVIFCSSVKTKQKQGKPNQPKIPFPLKQDNALPNQAPRDGITWVRGCMGTVSSWLQGRHSQCTQRGGVAGLYWVRSGEQLNSHGKLIRAEEKEKVLELWGIKENGTGSLHSHISKRKPGPLTWSLIAYEAKQMLDTSQVYKGPMGHLLSKQYKMGYRFI